MQRAQADQGVEDVTLFRQNRVDYGRITLADIGSQALDGDRAAASGISFTDTEAVLKQDSGQFTVALESDGSDQAQPLRIGYGDIAT